MRNGLADILDDLDRQDKVQVFFIPVLCGRLLHIRDNAAHGFIAADLDVRRTQARDHDRQECLRHLLMDQHLFHGITHTRTLDLRVHADIRGLL